MPRKPGPHSREYWSKQYELQKERGDTVGQLERQRARREYDAKGIDRTGKDIDHKKKIADGGKSSSGNMRLRSVKSNRSDNLHHKGEKK